MTSAPLTLPAHATMFTGALSAAARRARQRRLLPRRRGGHAGRAPRRAAAIGPAPSSALTCSTPSGASIRASSTTSTTSTCSKVKALSLGNVHRRADEVVDLALPWLETVARRAVLRLAALLRCARALRRRRSRSARAMPAQPYNGEVAFADAQVGRVVDFLDASRVCSTARSSSSSATTARAWASTTKARTASSSTRRPRACRSSSARRSAARRARRVAGLVRTVDLMPTVLDLLGLPALERHRARARSLVAADDRRSRASWSADGYAEAMYPLHHYGWSALKAIRDGRYKLIDAPRPELFDLELDPGETVNLFDRERDVANRLQRALRAMETGFERRRRRAGAAGRRRSGDAGAAGLARLRVELRRHRERRRRRCGPIRRTRSRSST